MRLQPIAFLMGFSAATLCSGATISTDPGLLIFGLDPTTFAGCSHQSTSTPNSGSSSVACDYHYMSRSGPSHIYAEVFGSGGIGGASGRGYLYLNLENLDYPTDPLILS